jgi:hypothetical protein
MYQVWNMWIFPSMSPDPLYCIPLLRSWKEAPYICLRLLCLKLEEETISEILVADAYSLSGAETSDVADF